MRMRSQVMRMRSRSSNVIRMRILLEPRMRTYLTAHAHY